MKLGMSNLKKWEYLRFIVIGIILSSIFPTYANANKYHRNANAWCADYTRLHPGKQCRVVHRGRLCPRGFRRAHKFGRIIKGFKSCIPGKKGTVIKQGIKKGINAVANLSPGLLLTGYRKYFNRIKINSRGRARLSSAFIEHYQHYYKNNLRKVVISLSSRVPANTAMTDCHHIYFPSGTAGGRRMFNLINRGRIMATNGALSTADPNYDDSKRWLLHELTHTQQCSHAGGRSNYALRWFGQAGGGLIRTLISGNYHMNIARQIHSKNRMEKKAEKKAQRLRHL